MLVFNRAGKIVRTIGSRGSGPGQLLAPEALAVSGSTVYIADTGNGRIVRYSTSGTHIGSIGRFRSIRGIAVRRQPRLRGRRGDEPHQRADDKWGGRQRDRASASCKSPQGIVVDGAGDLWVADRGNDRVVEFAPDGTLLGAFGEKGTGSGQFLEPTGIAVDCHGLVTVSEAENNRLQQFQVPPTGAGCAALPAITPPPNPILATQPDPLPPQVAVTPTRTNGIFAIRQFPLKINCDSPCKVSIVVKLTPKAGKKKPSVALSFSPQSLPAGKTITVRPRLSVAALHKLTKAMKGKRALVADVQVTAEAAHSAPAVVTRRLNVTG